MGTIINGNKWSGVYVNGNVVSGLVKNGAVFYKKNQQELYKRRIMVGDNLDKKTLFFDFPDDFYKNFQNKFVYENNIITCEVNNDLPKICFSVGLDPNTLDRMNIYDYALGIEGSIYEYDIINNSLKSNMKKALINVNSGESEKVKYITNDSNDSKIYRNIYIEDPNIRPIQVGDKIVSGTKFFFNIPDDYAEKVREEFGSTYTTSTSWVTSGDGKINIQWINYGYASYVMGVTLNEYGYAENVYAWGQQSYNYSTQIYEGEDTVITEVNVIDILYPEGYILVDTTTLGA